MASRLSERVAFAGALTLSASYSANPSVNGEFELAIVKRTKIMEVWVWTDDSPAERMLTLPASADSLRVVEAVAESAITVAAAPDQFTARNAWDPLLPELLALAICEGDDLELDLAFLLALGEGRLRKLHQAAGSLLSYRVLAIVGRARALLEEAALDLQELDTIPLPPFGDDLLTIERSLIDAFSARANEAWRVSMEAAKANEVAESQDRLRQERLAPFKQSIRALVARWSEGRPVTILPHRRYVVAGAQELTRALEDHVVEHGRLPRGTINVVSRGARCSFLVNVDELQKAS